MVLSLMVMHMELQSHGRGGLKVSTRGRGFEGGCCVVDRNAVPAGMGGLNVGKVGSRR